jgi:hypothetical protein
MNRIQLRDEVSRWTQKAEAKKESARPSDADVDALKGLWDFRKKPSILSAPFLESSRDVLHGDEPDWNSWPSIAARFKAYHAALAEVDNKSSIPLAKMRLRGV